MTSASFKVLVVDDEKTLTDLIATNLEFDDFIVEKAYNGEEALQKFVFFLPDLVILDINMPGKDGFEVLKEIREKSDAAVLFLTARTQVKDRLLGFDLGADDYLIKPFALPELLARVKSILKRTRSHRSEEMQIQHVGSICIDRGKHKLLNGQTEIDVSASEFLIFDELYKDALWEKGSIGDTQALRMMVSRLRKKISDAGVIDVTIRSIRGVGYVLDVTSSPKV